jgi:hypothetical protein
MRLPFLTKPWPQGRHEVRPCPVCGKPWWPWAGSLLPCHARCLFAPEELRAVQTDTRPAKEVAAAYGITVQMVRSARRRA